MKSNLARYIGETVKMIVGNDSTVSGTLQLVNDQLHIGLVPLPDGNWRVVKERGEYWLKKMPD